MKIKLTKKLLGWVVVLVAVPSLIANYFLLEKYQGEKEKNMVLVIDVLDGDTFLTEDGQKLRLLDVDAPELEFCGGKESKKRLEELIENKKISVERVGTDVYQRSLVMAYDGNKLINRVMLAEGWGVYGARKIPESEEFKKLQEKAREGELGIFGPES